MGVGAPDTATNPLARFGLPALAALGEFSGLTTADVEHRGGAPAPHSRHGLHALDATLGVPGTPQSATGQSALLTGTNAARMLGRHQGPYPGAQLAPLLAHGTWWHDAIANGRSAAYANAFPDRYLDRASGGTGRMGAIARSALLAEVRLRGPVDLAAGAAVSAFITNEGWREVLGYSHMPDRSPDAAGRILAALAGEHDLVVFEFYATDIAGHKKDWAAALKWLATFDVMAAAAREQLDPADTILVVSDHGNLEDLSHGRHTTNPALALWLGGPPPGLPLAALTDIAPAVRAALGSAFA